MKRLVNNRQRHEQFTSGKGAGMIEHSRRAGSINLWHQGMKNEKRAANRVREHGMGELVWVEKK